MFWAFFVGLRGNWASHYLSFWSLRFIVKEKGPPPTSETPLASYNQKHSPCPGLDIPQGRDTPFLLVLVCFGSKGVAAALGLDLHAVVR